MIRPSAARLGAAFLVPILVLAACGGSTASSSPASGTATTGATPTPAPTTGGAGGSGGAGQPSFELPSFDLSKLGGAIPGVASYRVSITVGGVKQYDSMVVEQPVLSKAITLYDDTGAVSQRVVVIGQNVWSASGPSGAFVAIPAGLAGALLLGFDPATLLGIYASIDWRSAASNQGEETKNGVQALHVRIDPSLLSGAFASLGAGASIDAWIADAGYLVALETTGGASSTDSLQIEVTNIDDPANVIATPS